MASNERNEADGETNDIDSALLHWIRMCSEAFEECEVANFREEDAADTLECLGTQEGEVLSIIATLACPRATFPKRKEICENDTYAWLENIFAALRHHYKCGFEVLKSECAHEDPWVRKTATRETVQLLLVSGVCGQNKEQFVGSVMKLDQAQQISLMMIIKEVMEQWQTDAEEEVEEDDEGDADASFASTYSSNSLDSQHSSFRAIKSPLRTDSADILSDEGDEITKDFAALSDFENDEKTESSDTKECERRESNVLSTTCDEDDVSKNVKETHSSDSSRSNLKERRRERELSEKIELLRKRESNLSDLATKLQQDLDATTERAKEMESKAQLVPGLQTRLSELQDEVDVLKPLASRVSKAEAQLSKYESQLEDAADVKDHARRLEAKQEEQMAEIMRLEKVAAFVPKLEEQLAKYKAQLTEQSLEVAELIDREAEATQKLKRVMSECASLRKDTALNRSQLERDRALREATEAGEANARAFDCGDMSSQVAKGISELNPEIHAKLCRLEDENARLRKRISDEAQEKLNQLSADLDDAKRLAEGFRKKYRLAVQRGDALSDDLERSRERCAQEVSDHAATRRAAVAAARRAAEMLSMQEEDKRSEIARHERGACTRIWRERFATVAIGASFHAFRTRCRSDLVSLTKRCVRRVEVARAKRRRMQVACNKRIAEMNAKHKASTESLLVRYRQQCQRTATVEREVGLLRQQCRDQSSGTAREKELNALIVQLQAEQKIGSSSRVAGSERRRGRRRGKSASGISSDSFRVLEAELDTLRRDKKEQLLLKARETQRRLTAERQVSSVRSALEELQAKHTATLLKMRRMMGGKSIAIESTTNDKGDDGTSDVSTKVRLLQSKLEKVEAENASNRKRGLEIMRKLNGWRQKAHYWKKQFSVAQKASPSSESGSKGISTPSRPSTTSKARVDILSPISVTKRNQGIDSSSRQIKKTATPNGWSGPLVRVRSCSAKKRQFTSPLALQRKDENRKPAKAPSCTFLD